MAENDYVKAVADSIIEQLERGTAPWQRPWEPGERRLPYNPTTGNDYRGLNAVWLSVVGDSKGYNDARWMTYKQASEAGAQVRGGERGTAIQYWMWSEQRPALDDNGRPVLNADGTKQTVTVQLARPKVFQARVFNGAQIDGLPLQPLRLTEEWQRHQDAEQILANSGARIFHRDGNRAFYNVERDDITLPLRGQFTTADKYYATALHELGHWTGHSSRLNRDLAHPFGSVGYAKEELRAEIASLMIGDRLGIGHDPEQHAAYVGSWIKALKDDPREIFRAAADAEKITGHVFSLGQAQQQTQATATTTSEAIEVNMALGVARSRGGERTRLDVPYAEKDQAKAAAKEAGIKLEWDGQAKSWFAPPGADLTKLAQWLPGNRIAAAAVPENPQEAFAMALREAKFVIDGLPEMDGKLHRVPVEGDRQNDKGVYQERSGAYVGYLDGRPAGFIQNHRAGFKRNWTHAAASSLPIDTTKLAEEAEAKKAARAAAQAQVYEETAVLAAAIWDSGVPAPADHRYLTKKGVPPHGLRVATEDTARLFNGPREAAGKAALDLTNHLLVPVQDIDGKIWSIQHIAPNGQKGFLEGGKIAGNFYPIGGRPQTPDAVQLVGEGFATCATVRDLTNQPVAVAFHANNLPNVAAQLRAADPNRALVIAGDNDRKGEVLDPPKPNVGAEKARAAAEAVNGTALLPPAASGTAVDWNDYATATRDAARTQLAEGILTARMRNNARNATPEQIAGLQAQLDQNPAQQRVATQKAATQQPAPATQRQARGRGR
ncbi:MAG: zincin-like metallopeptidase domain-containing protein [Magnetospirillum sp.]|nr:zincin-like metallopeptidase domain-containing protein [Magnetospirillum sp.]